MAQHTTKGPAGSLLPWYVVGSRGRPGHTNYTVRDAAGRQVCECSGEDDGHEEAVAIAAAVNRAGPRICARCGAPATCFGSYEDDLSPAFACDDCCGHGNEDGQCEPVTGDRPVATVVAGEIMRGILHQACANCAHCRLQGPNFTAVCTRPGPHHMKRVSGTFYCGLWANASAQSGRTQRGCAI